MKDIVILFGAGASYGCGGIVPEQPPLGFQLFSILKYNYPGSWGALPEEVDRVFENDFEAGMQLIHDRYGGAIPGLMREMAVYFIQFRPHGYSSIYGRLISDLDQAGLLKRSLLSTLNYECVLERIVCSYGHTISYFDEGDDVTIPVWKLHGSCNMFATQVQADQGVSYGTDVVWDGGVEAYLDSDQVIRHCLCETGLAPVMCLFMRGKTLNVSPSVIKGLQESWRDKVAMASAVICVGVRPLVEDTHIWDPIAKTEAPLLFVGDGKSLSEWEGQYRQGLTEHIGDRFDQAYPKLMERIVDYGTKSGT